MSKEPSFTQAGLANFKSTVLADPFSHLTPPSRIILVDHARTGTSLAEFVLLLRSAEYFNLVPASTEIFFINLAYPETPLGQKDLGPPLKWARVELFPDLPNLVVPTLARYDYGWVGRLIPTYPAEYWEVNWRQVPNPDESTAKVILKKIQAKKKAMKKSQKKEKEKKQDPMGIERNS